MRQALSQRGLGKVLLLPIWVQSRKLREILMDDHYDDDCECEGCEDMRSDAADYIASEGRDWETDMIYGDAN